MTEQAPAPSRAQAWTWRIIWLAAAAPAIGQLGLLLYATLARVGYPYDLEWMEGGMLGHASRISERQGIYVEPSVDFIPYLYTPLYPALLALFGSVFGLGYGLGRALSVLSMLAVIGFMVTAIYREREVDRWPRLVGGVIAVGLFAATYPWVEGWYDLVRGDTMFLAMIIGGSYGLLVWARMPGAGGRRRVGIAAAVLALSFFCKQTGVMYVAAGGVALAVLNWRRVPMYVGIAGAIGLGGTWLLNRASSGWFWTYVYEVHQAHDWNIDRFYASFGNILGHFPIMTAVIAVSLIAVLASVIVHRKRPVASTAFLYWTALFAFSCLVGAIGWGTQWAHFNAYIPAMTTGAIAAGAGVVAIIGAARSWPVPSWLPTAAGLASALALAAQLAMAWWRPASFIPTAADHKAGDELIDTLRRIEGDVFMPYHPWYPVMAGKPLYVHRMGVMDMTYGNAWQVEGLEQALAEHRFAAVIMDDRPVGAEFRALRRSYRMDDYLPKTASPRVYSGAKVVPRAVWVPARPVELPEDAQVLWDFEDGRLDGWKATGTAWGRRPASGPVGKQGAVRRYGGRYFVTSYHGGDKATGSLVSDEFLIEGSRITFRLSGGKRMETLRAELWVDDVRERVATGNQSEGMDVVMWNVAHLQDRIGRIVLVDNDDGSWGHLNADEFWIWK